MSKFVKVVKPLKLTRVERELIQDDEDKKQTTSNASYFDGWHRGFIIQKAKDNPSNRKRGDHHTRCLDKLIDATKWVCSRHGKSLIFRYSLYPSYDLYGIDVKKFHKDLVERLNKVTIDNFNTMVSSFTGKRTLKFVEEFTANSVNDNVSRTRKVFTSAEYIWARELGYSEYNSGVHYHGAFFCNKLQGRSANQLHKVFRIIAFDCIRLQLQANLKKCREGGNKHIQITAALENLTPFKNSEEIPETPYVDVEGYFELHRNGLSLEKAKVQKSLIQKEVNRNGQYPRLRVDQIVDRKHNKGKVIGGDLEECIYAISYLSKVASKTLDDFPSGTRRFNSSKFTKLKKTDSDYERILEKSKEVEQYFAVYHNRQKPS
ncbi:hypothetical protein NQT74_14590 [Alteromonas stellipolaris]|uniref:hypothetical protein n=1 Tax=Alteromonas stellipolaris TaxID=233316 RepID=UPI002119ACBE|nr:hypothetical protein [Alteromonas stellipolaris]MCQ8849812.1 hypothetical protein [Alteromonas stellipolaris]